MKINEVRSLVMTRAVEVAKENTVGTWRERISAALKSIWAAFKEVARIAAKPSVIVIPDKILSVQHIKAMYSRMCYRLTGEVTVPDLVAFRNEMLAEVKPIPHSERSRKEGRSLKGLKATQDNLAEVLTRGFLVAEGFGIWDVSPVKGGYEFIERGSDNNLTIKGADNLSQAWRIFGNALRSEGRG